MRINKELQVGVAFISQQRHKAQLAMSGPDLMGIPKKWIEAGDGPEPRSPFPYEIGPGKLSNQLSQPRVKEQILGLDGTGIVWARANLDISLVHSGNALGKPDGNPWESVGVFGRHMLTDGKKREMRFDNIMTTHVPLIDAMMVSWRSLDLFLPEAMIRWLADPSQIEIMVDKGWVEPEIISSHSNAGLRWDKLPKIWPWLRRELDGARVGKDLRIVERSSGRAVIVDDKHTGVEADMLMTAYTRGIVPGLLGNMISASQQCIDIL